MKIIIKKPNFNSEVIDIELTLNKIQEIVGGYYEKVHIGYNLVALANENGITLKLEDNFIIKDSIIKGNVIIVKEIEGHYIGLNEEEINYAKTYILNGNEQMKKKRV